MLWLAVYSTRAIHLVGRSQMRSHFYVRMSLCISLKCMNIPLMMGSTCSFFTKRFFSSSCHDFYTHFESVFKLPFDWKPRIFYVRKFILYFSVYQDQFKRNNKPHERKKHNNIIKRYERNVKISEREKLQNHKS